MSEDEARRHARSMGYDVLSKEEQAEIRSFSFFSRRRTLAEQSRVHVSGAETTREPPLAPRAVAIAGETIWASGWGDAPLC